MHGSRPDLFQLRQLILGALIITGVIAILAGVVWSSRNRPRRQSVSQKWKLVRPRRAFNSRVPAKAMLADGLWSLTTLRLRGAQLNSQARTEQTIVFLSQFLIPSSPGT